MEPALLWLATRLKSESRAVAERWLDRLTELLLMARGDVFPSRKLLDHVPALIEEIADSIHYPPGHDISANAGAMQSAAELGELRYTQQARLDQLTREFAILSDLLEDFFVREIAGAPTPVDAVAAVQAVSRALQSVRIVQQHTVDCFVAKYLSTIELQTAQLRSFSRLVSHEIRQPLGVLQVITRALAVKDGDMEAARMMDIFDRSVARLTDVTGKLERLARIPGAADRLPSEHRVDLSELAADVALQLADAAEQRGVSVRVEENLPVLTLDPVRAELVFVNLLSNAIKYSDPSKAARVVEVVAVEGAFQPTVAVRDNGIGIPAHQLRQIFREFVRAHAQRDEQPGPHGLGLGLAIVRECMDAANGSVRVSSREGQGTTFTLAWDATLAAR